MAIRVDGKRFKIVEPTNSFALSMRKHHEVKTRVFFRKPNERTRHGQLVKMIFWLFSPLPFFFLFFSFLLTFLVEFYGNSAEFVKIMADSSTTDVSVAFHCSVLPLTTSSIPPVISKASWMRRCFCNITCNSERENSRKKTC